MAGMSTAGFAGLVAGEGWHYVGEAGEPAFATGWANAGAPVPALAFRLREAGVVDVAGVVVSGVGAGSTIFTLPSGYRPTAQGYLIVAVADPAISGNVLIVETDGDVLTPDVHQEVYISGSFFLDSAQAP